MGEAGTLSFWGSEWGRLRFPALDVSLIALPSGDTEVKEILDLLRFETTLFGSKIG